MVRNEKAFQQRFGWLPSETLENHFRYFFDVAKTYNPSPNLNAVGGKTAVAFFSRSNLPTLLLQQIWGIADYDKKGELDFEKFCIACRLISLAQNGKQANMESLKSFSWMTIPLPKFVGIEPPCNSVDGIIKQSAPLVSSFNPGTNVNISGPWYLAPRKKLEYAEIFSKTAQTREDQIKLFSDLGLTFQQLTLLWDLCDISKAGVLEENEFCAAMHLAYGVSQRGMELPVSLPPELGLKTKKLRSAQSEADALLVEIDSAERKIIQEKERKEAEERAAKESKEQEVFIQVSTLAAERQSKEIEELYKLSCTLTEMKLHNLSLAKALNIAKSAKTFPAIQAKALNDEKERLKSRIVDLKTSATS